MALEILLTDVVNEKPETLRKISQVLLMLAGDVSVQNGGSQPTNAEELAEHLTEVFADDIQRLQEAGSALQVADFRMDPEGKLVPKPDIDPPAQPTPAEVFATSTAAVVPSQTALEVTAETTSTETPTAPVPPAPTSEPPVAPAAPHMASPAEADERDTEGLHWDARIHSRTKSKIANGTWKLMRGVDSALVDQVKREQLGTVTPATGTTPLPPATFTPAVEVDAPKPPAAPPPPAAPATAPEQAPSTASTAPASSTPTSAPAAPGATVQDSSITWLSTVTRTSKGMKDGKWTQEQLGEIMKQLGVPGVSALNAPEKRPILIELNSILDTLEASA